MRSPLVPAKPAAAPADLLAATLLVLVCAAWMAGAGCAASTGSVGDDCFRSTDCGPGLQCALSEQGGLEVRSCVTAGTVTCVRDVDCLYDEACFQSRCTPGDYCSQDQDCRGGKRCLDTVCIDAKPYACVVDDDCVKAEARCVDSKCTLEPLAYCNDDTECKFGCLEGRCAGCADDGDCQYGTSCVADYYVVPMCL